MYGRGDLTRFVVISMILLSSIVLISNSSNASGLNWSTQKQLHEGRNETAIVISCQFDSTLHKEFLDKNQFEQSDSLTYARFYLLDSTEDIPLIAIMVKSPSDNRTVYDLDEILASDRVPISYEARELDVFDSLRFDEEGIWVIKFHLDKSNVYLYEFDGFFIDFLPSSEVIPLSGGYKGLEILSPSIVQQVKVGKTSENLLFWQQVGIVITLLAFGATAFMVWYTRKSVRIAQRSVQQTEEEIKLTRQSVDLTERSIEQTERTIEESLKEKRRDTSIIPMIVDGIDNFAEIEFNWLNGFITDLKQKRIVASSSRLNSDELTDAVWRDFRREDPDIYTRLEEYVKLKDNYSITHNKLIKAIDKALDNFRKQQSKFDKEMQIIIKKRYPSESLEEFYSDRVKPKFKNAIRCNENNISHSEICPLFNKFSTPLSKIRRKGNVKNLLDELLGHVKQFENYANLKEIFCDKKEELMRKYNLYDGDLEVYYQKHYQS